MSKLFIVRRQERWEQLVSVEAENAQEALDKAYAADCTINDDAEFVEFIHKENAEVMGPLSDFRLLETTTTTDFTG